MCEIQIFSDIDCEDREIERQRERIESKYEIERKSAQNYIVGNEMPDMLHKKTSFYSILTT